MSDTNLRTYNSGNVIKWYKNLNTLTPVEISFFESHKAFLANGQLLDIGIGGGRTTRYLLDKCKTYIGIDYSAEFVSAVKTVYPKADIRLMDARDLSAFKENTFDIINFSFNGIDYVDAEGRTNILSEINRVLKPGGIFFFSTHNKEQSSFGRQPWLNKSNSFFINLKTFVKLFPFLFRHIINKKKEIYLQDHAIINDSAHNYSLMTFYTSPAFLKKQLTEYHFDHIALLSKDGSLLAGNEPDEWIFVTCKKLLS